LNDPDPIPCLNSAEAQKWIYQFPDTFDLENDAISLNFTCNSLKDPVKFIPEQNRLVLDLKSKLPVKGSYPAQVILTDLNGSGLSTVYNLLF
jgi:hypothetical protein